jgi:DNA phosphorothioation-associated putative methyltransferase
VEVSWYQKHVSAISIGKRVGRYRYLHRETLTVCDLALHDRIVSVTKEWWPDDEWNVVKIDVLRPIVSTLHYPDFREIAHPQLRRAVSLKLDLGLAREINYRKASNTPILHRKETLLLTSDPEYKCFAALTRAEEKAGLYATPWNIGYLRQWNDLLRTMGVRIEGHTLLDN